MCGAVRFSVPSNPGKVLACHCAMCRRWCSGPFFAVSCGADMRFESDAAIGLVASSDWAERGFCKRCGSSLFYRLRGSGEHQMAAGLFDDQTGFELRLQVFADEAQGYCALAAETKMMTGAELAAIYATAADKEG